MRGGQRAVRIVGTGGDDGQSLAHHGMNSVSSHALACSSVVALPEIGKTSIFMRLRRCFFGIASGRFCPAQIEPESSAANSAAVILSPDLNEDFVIVLRGDIGA